MNARPPSRDPASRFRAIAVLLALACAALAATVLVLVLRPPERGSPLSSPPPVGTAPWKPSPLFTAVNRAEIADEPGMYRVDGQITLSVRTKVRRAAEQAGELVTEIPEGTVVDLVAKRSGWTLIAWPNGAGGVLIGWVVLPSSAAGL